MAKGILVGLSLLLMILETAPPALGQCVLDWADGFAAPGMNDVVRALAVFDDGSGPALYAGGDFGIAGEVRATHIAKWDGTAWSALGSGTNDYVYALAVYDDGNGPALYVGGEFTSAGGVPARRIAKWDGVSWSALGSGMEGGPYPCRVYGLTVFDDGTGPRLYAGGSFTEAGGVPACGIAQWDGVGWSHVGGSMTGRVNGLTVHDDGSGPALYAAGNFSHAGGVPALDVAKWDGSNWSALGSGTGPWMAEAYALTALDDGEGPALYMGGRFETAGGINVNHIARWDGSAWSALGTGLGGVFLPEARSLTAYDDGSGPCLYVGGEFATAGGVNAHYVAKWDGSNWSALGSGMVGGTSWGPSVFAWAVFDDGNGPSLYAGGDFSTAGDVGAPYVARWDGTGFSALGAGNGMGNWVHALKVFDPPGAKSGPGLYVGGRFHAAGVISANHIARWDGASWSALGSGLNGDVFALTVFDDGSGPALYVGGDFGIAGEAGATHIAKWDGENWSPLGCGMNHFVFALTVYDDGSGPALYAGGFFTTAGGVEANHVAKWDGSTWSPLGSGMSGGWNLYVAALAVFDDGNGPALYAGGNFGSAGGVCVNHIAKWDGTSWSPLGSGMAEGQGPYPWVWTLAVFDDVTGPALYAGGDFRTAGGVSVNGIASWDGSTWSPLGSGLGTWGTARSLAVFDDGRGLALYAGGGFNTAGGVVVTGIARWDGTSWSALGSGFSYGSADALASFDDGSGSALYAGGDLMYAGGRASARIAKWACVGDLVLGDVNCDGVVDQFDIDPFVLALINAEAYELAYPDCDIRTADCNYDGAVDTFDIDRFVDLLTGP